MGFLIDVVSRAQKEVIAVLFMTLLPLMYIAQVYVVKFRNLAYLQQLQLEIERSDRQKQVAYSYLIYHDSAAAFLIVASDKTSAYVVK